jgi:hypothetical protein
VKVGAPVPKNQIQAGDLVFSSWDGKPHSHVGIATGDGRLLNAPHPGATVRYANLNSNYLAHVDAVRRIPGVDGSTAGAGLTDAELRIPAPGPAGDLVGAINRVGSGIQQVGEAASKIGAVADWLLKLAMPSNLVRLVCAIAGAGFVALGLFHLGYELKRENT